jgi:hypothetical protein
MENNEMENKEYHGYGILDSLNNLENLDANTLEISQYEPNPALAVMVHRT